MLKILLPIATSLMLALPTPSLMLQSGGTTNSQTCDPISVDGSDCTISLTITQIPLDLEDECATKKVQVTGTIRCGSASCSISEIVCDNSDAPIEWRCNGDLFTVDPNVPWVDLANGNEACSNIQASAIPIP